MKRKGAFLIIVVTIYLISSYNISALSLNCNNLLKQGSRGEEVKTLQKLLNQKENCNLTTDGIFGKNTKNCVINFQNHNNLQVDGIVGRDTCNALNGTKASIAKTKPNNSIASSNPNTSSTKAYKIYKKSKIKKGVVNVSKANIRKSPSESAKKIGKVSLGKVITILGQEYDWYRIKGNNNKIGYIRADLISKNCIIVDISDQKLIVYTDGAKDWTTNVITGNKGNHDTPIGSYILKPVNIAQDVELVGKDYKSPVDYWMPFITERGIGFHDAKWREEYQYNSGTYQGSGSHGCVNMKHAAAEKLYNSITKDINVIIRK